MLLAARYEGRIVQKLLHADGGSGEYAELPPPFLQVWDLLQEGVHGLPRLALRGGAAHHVCVEPRAAAGRLGEFELRQGNAGDAIAREDIDATSLFVNMFE